MQTKYRVFCFLDEMKTKENGLFVLVRFGECFEYVHLNGFS